jgi:hypothetical protein
VTDWATTISALATGVGTLVLAVATFGSVRSANRAARTAESSMLAGMRPILMNSRLQDPGQKVGFADDRWVAVPGGGAAVEAADSAVYLAISVRNAGTGMGILHGWRLRPGAERPPSPVHPPLDEFTPQTRDMYVAPGEVGFWQGALRDPDHQLFKEITAAIEAGEIMSLDLLYGDFEGGQRVVSRFSLQFYRAGAGPGDAPPPPAGPAAQGQPAAPVLPVTRADAATAAAATPRPTSRWLASVVRHWNVDRPDPR